MLSLVTRENGAVAFRAQADVLGLCLTIAAGPLVMWLAWLALRRKRAGAGVEARA